MLLKFSISRCKLFPKHVDLGLLFGDFLLSRRVALLYLLHLFGHILEHFVFLLKLVIEHLSLVLHLLKLGAQTFKLRLERLIITAQLVKLRLKAFGVLELGRQLFFVVLSIFLF